jgi:hypothetical protein
MNLLWATVIGLTGAACAFVLLGSLLVRGFAARVWRALTKPLLLAGVLGWALISMAAVTQINLATQVFGLLPGTNGGTGVSSTATYPGSGTIMITTTGVTASQLPAPTVSTLGGVESITCGANSAITTISTAGAPSCVSTGATFNQGAPSGTINSSNTSFTLSPTPANSANVSCFLNGIQQQQGAGDDYTISGATITYLTAPPTGSKLNCLWY